jgi:opacity protein-like surface antigen
LKHKLILITVLALGSMAHAQGFLSNLSLGAGMQGVFPSTTINKSAVANNLSVVPNGIQSTTNSAGYVGDARYDFGRHSALDVSITYTRNSEVFFNNSFGSISFPERKPTNELEIIGSYIVRLPSREHVKPYALIGGGVVHFSPRNNYTGLTPSTQMKLAFAYGFGTDVKVNDHWAVRLQYRGLVRSEPDFGLLTKEPFGTGLKTHVVEPSIAVIYHF